MFDAQVEGTGLKALPPTRAAPGLLEHTGHAGEKARETMGRIVERLRKHDRSAHRQYNGLRRKREGKQECAKGRGNTNTSSVSLFAIVCSIKMSPCCLPIHITCTLVKDDGQITSRLLSLLNRRLMFVGNV
eukprot:4823309-Pyramimonas_sp.AAC.1